MKNKNISEKSKLTWRKVYDKCNHNKYSQITNIKGNLELKSNCKNFVANYSFIIIVTILVLLMIFIYTFRNNPIGILYCIGVIAALFLLALYTSTYKIAGKDHELNIYNSFQKNSIKYKDIINIYLSKTKMHFMGFPINSYTLNIIYVQGNQQILVSLPTIMLNKKDVISFFKELEIKKLKDEEEEVKQKEKEKKTIIKTIIWVTLSVLAVCAIIYVAVTYKPELL